MMQPLIPPGASVWTLTDGKAGDSVQCLGVAEALGATPDIRTIAPRPPFSWLAPWGPIDPAERPARPVSPIRPPFPDVLIASGRRTHPYVRFVKRASGGRTFTVILKSPSNGAKAADFIWVPAHDALRAPNVMTTIVSPHRLTPEKLAAARKSPPAALLALPAPRAAVLVGGDAISFTFTDDNIRDFADKLAALSKSGVSLMGTLSRRTPPKLAATMKHVFERNGGWLWDGSGDNPLVALLALADAVVVTADSINMVGEAAATGRPVLVFTPGGRGHPKFTRFLDTLRAKGAVRNFAGRLEGQPYPPIDSTPEIAAAIAERYAAFRRTLS